MSTAYPTDLPAVPGDRWAASRIGNGGDPDEGTAWVEFDVPARDIDPDTAERRVLAVLDHDYEDDLRGALATATRRGQGYVVRVHLARPGY